MSGLVFVIKFVRSSSSLILYLHLLLETRLSGSPCGREIFVFVWSLFLLLVSAKSHSLFSMALIAAATNQSL